MRGVLLEGDDLKKYRGSVWIERGGDFSARRKVDLISRGRSLGRWKDRVKEYMCERGATRRGGFEQVRREYLDKERWRLFLPGARWIQAVEKSHLGDTRIG